MEEVTKQSPGQLLSLYFTLHFPEETARVLESMESKEAVNALKDLPENAVLKAVECLTPSMAARLITAFSKQKAVDILVGLDLGKSANLLSRLPATKQKQYLALMKPSIAKELSEYMVYPEGSAGSLMNTQIVAFNENTTVAKVRQQLKRLGLKTLSKVFLMNDENKLSGEIDVYRFVIANEEAPLTQISIPIQGVVHALDMKDEVIHQFELYKAKTIPVVDANQHLLGIIHSSTVFDTLKENIATEMQTMVGASKEERALSPSLFAVRKRLFWLNINLVTAFIAAAVVGLFEGTIAQITALAVLLPVVAGQSGNAGSQALAVTMRSLTLREITTRDWLRIVIKEFNTGLLNGIFIALVCGLGVYIWSKSVGLLLVIIIAMIISMTIACMAGSLVPLILRRVGLDPAQSSSIILTTVTDVAGFFSFLGIATLLASYI